MGALNTVSTATRWGIATIWTILFVPGCGDVTLDTTTSVNATPKEVLNPLAPDEIRRDEAADKKAAKPAVEPKAAKESNSKKSTAKIKSSPSARLSLSLLFTAPTLAIAGVEQDDSKAEIALETIKVADLPKLVAANKKAKLTMVNVWSTTCALAC